MKVSKILKRFTFVTPLGWMGLVGSEVGLRRVILPKKTRDEVSEEILSLCGPLESDPALFKELPAFIERYMEGQEVCFHESLDIGWATPFCRGVWEATMSIPWGQTRSYSWVAEKIGRPNALRAVGRALSLNPVPIVVPCHRVVGRGGDLVGFSAGLDMKRQLLVQEGGRF